MSIYSKICSGACDHAADTGKEANNVYLGREEAKELEKWLYEEGYLEYSAELKNKEGDSRPEISGLLMYEVNQDRHMAFSS
tara:strand:+ start:56 stop:298 length:243 start_codon:yes stop_codon:yes gene_type:complete